MTEVEMQEAAGLVARVYAKINGAPRYLWEERWAAQCRLSELGVTLDRPMPPPTDPSNPTGSNPAAMQAVA